MPSRVRASLACKRLHKFPAGNGGNENSRRRRFLGIRKRKAKRWRFYDQRHRGIGAHGLTSQPARTTNNSIAGANLRKL